MTLPRKLLIATLWGLFLGVSSAIAQMHLVGSIDSHYGVKMVLNRSGNTLSGSYRYSTGSQDIKLSGTIDAANNIALKEFSPQGKNTGSFSGKLVPGKRITGIWSKIPGNKDNQMPFVLGLAGNPSALDLGADGIIITDDIHKLLKHNPDFPERKEAVVHIPKVVNQGLSRPDLVKNLQQALSPKRVYDQSLDEMAAEIKSGDIWLNDATYNIDYNRNYLVDGDFTIAGLGAYSSESTKHVVINTKTGKPLTVREAFNRNSLAALASMVRKAMNNEVEAAIKEQPCGGGNEFRFLFTPAINQDPLASFSIDDTGVTFLHDWQFPHVYQAVQPIGRYYFSYKSLAPFIRKDGPLGVFVR